MKRLAAIAGLAATAVLPQCSPPSTAAAAGEGSLFRVERGDLDIALTENGTVMAKDSQKLTFKIRGDGRITFLVPEGTEVAEGDVVCRLDTTEVQKNIEQLELELLTAETELSTNRTNLEIQEAENLAALEKAKNDREKAEKELERWVNGDAPQALRKLKVELKDAETVFNRAKKKYEDSEQLLTLKYIKQIDLEDDRIAFEKAQVTMEGASLAIELFEKYVYPMTLTEKEIAVRDAHRGLSTAEKRAQSQLLQKQVAVAQSEKRVAALKRNIADKKTDVENMTLRAPCPGIVIYGDPRAPWYTENIKVGGNVWEGTTLMTIPDLRVMLVKLEIHEADINKLAVGQPASITMDTYAGLTLAGQITKVAQIAASSNPFERRAEVKRFDVEITITCESAVKLKPGISAKVEIRIGRRDDVLFVPLQCVYVAGGKHRCRVMEGDAPAEREVAIGQSNDKYAEVVTGLSEGERVLLYNPGLPVAPARDGEPGTPEQEQALPTTAAARPLGEAK